MDEDWEPEDMKLLDYLFFVLLGAVWLLMLAVWMFMFTALIFL